MLARMRSARRSPWSMVLQACGPSAPSLDMLSTAALAARLQPENITTRDRIAGFSALASRSDIEKHVSASASSANVPHLAAFHLAISAASSAVGSGGSCPPVDGPGTAAAAAAGAAEGGPASAASGPPPDAAAASTAIWGTMQRCQRSVREGEAAPCTITGLDTCWVCRGHRQQYCSARGPAASI